MVVSVRGVCFWERIIEQHSLCSSPSTGTRSPKESFMERGKKKRKRKRNNKEKEKQQREKIF